MNNELKIINVGRQRLRDIMTSNREVLVSVQIREPLRNAANVIVIDGYLNRRAIPMTVPIQN